ncbi:MAG: TetR/AcrR family transcriptional regulator [Bacteroidales bacterium]|jgi:AcrR family transcriptional regulator|nr:TetR/AcrR family transcriptional regulator [Bacteroidales bacterium]
MAGQKLSTEEHILQVAREVFMQNGYDGTSMQMIADRAGINKSLLHYYYRSKERLFREIFAKVFSQFIPHLGVIFMSEMSLEEKVYAFADRYIDVFLENPLIPIFVMQELSKNPDYLAELIKEAGINPGLMIAKISQMLEDEGIYMKDVRHFFVNLLGLCIFPFAARPLIQRMMFDNEKEAYDNFLLERKKEVPQLILNAIRKR